jgi:Protein of unknown function (DUF3455)
MKETPMKLPSKQFFASALSSTLLAAGTTACTTMTPHPIAVPANLAPPATEKYAFVLPAKGVQIYECKAGADGKLTWAFVAPEADLFDTAGKLLGKHYGGPTWESLDGSKTVGTVKQRADASSPKDIPWLLLEAKASGATGSMTAVKHIQRVNTIGGAAPADGCTALKVGEKLRVAYTADYYYFISK